MKKVLMNLHECVATFTSEAVGIIASLDDAATSLEMSKLLLGVAKQIEIASLICGIAVNGSVCLQTAKRTAERKADELRAGLESNPMGESFTASWNSRIHRQMAPYISLAEWADTKAAQLEEEMAETYFRDGGILEG